jgi:general secretion pathway protein L
MNPMMAQTFLFRFSATDQVEWLAEDASVQQGCLAEMASYVNNSRPILIIPGESLLLTQAKVPGRQRATRTKAVPYALEDNLAEEVENLHFAIGELLMERDIPVAVVRHHTLQSWLETCTQEGITPAAVVPDILLLPYEDGAWSLLVENERAVLRIGPWQGFASERDNLPLLLQLALAEASEKAPQRLQVWGEATAELTHLGIPLQPQNLSHKPLQVFAAGYQGVLPINLLQGPYRYRAHPGNRLRPWRAAAILAGLWLGVNMLVQITEYRQLQQAQTDLQIAMEQLYKDAVPSAQKVVNPRVQLANRLNELRQNHHVAEDLFFDLLYAGGQPLLTINQVTLRSVRYKENQLDLELEGGNLELMDRLKRRYQEQAHLEVQMRTTKRDTKVQSQVTLSKSSS